MYQSCLWVCSKSRSIIAVRGPGQFIGEVLLFDNTGRDSPMGSWQTCVRARTQVQALILTVKDLKDLVTRKPAAEVELRAGQHCACCKLHALLFTVYRFTRTAACGNHYAVLPSPACLHEHYWPAFKLGHLTPDSLWDTAE